MPAGSAPGRSIVTRRAVVDLVRAATLGAYGVTGFTDPNLASKALRWARLQPQGIRVRLVPTLDIDLWVAVAWGLPVAEVARQLDSAVRYALRRALDRDVDSFSIHVNRLRILPGGSSPVPQPLPSRVHASALPVHPASAAALEGDIPVEVAAGPSAASALDESGR